MMKRLGILRSAMMIVASLALVGCGIGAQPKPKPQQPGLYGGVYLAVRSGNLRANVGLPVDWSPRARCVGSTWNLKGIAIVSGALPPGLRIDPGSIHLVGTPTRAGTWHLRVRFWGVTCAGNNYNDSTQDLHITTTGSSAPRKVD